MTFKEVKAKYRVGDNLAHKILKQLVDKGLMHKYDGCVLRDNKQIRQVWYRPIKLGAIPQKGQSRTV